MIALLCLALLTGAERVDLHLIEGEDLEPERRAELETALQTAITARAGRQVVIRSPASKGDADADRVLVRAFLGPRHLRVMATRHRPPLPPITAELDLPTTAFPDGSLQPLVDALFPDPRVVKQTELQGPGTPSSVPLWLMGASAGVGLAAAAVAVASTRPIPALQDRGLLDGSTWATSGSSLDARPIAAGLAIGAGLGCALALTLAALEDDE